MQNLNTKSVQNLSFVEELDQVDSNWSEYLVEFTYEGKELQGVLGACPHHPELMHDFEISDVEES
jgi:hypothetical protein